LINSGQKAAAPARIAATGTFLAGAENDERRQIVRFASETIGDPRAHAGPPELHRTGVHQQLRRCMVEGVRDHGPHYGNIIRNLCLMNQQL